MLVLTELVVSGTQCTSKGCFIAWPSFMAWTTFWWQPKLNRQVLRPSISLSPFIIDLLFSVMSPKKENPAEFEISSEPAKKSSTEEAQSLCLRSEQWGSSDEADYGLGMSWYSLWYSCLNLRCISWLACNVTCAQWITRIQYLPVSWWPVWWVDTCFLNTEKVIASINN